ncbi:hypothetical protein HBI47_030800 [Parastagonospora nodorum]|nr:hypothetical protein HBI47_030800 [Parastagonospora nodorum]
MCYQVVEKYSICRCLYHKHTIETCYAYGKRRHPVQEITVLVGYSCDVHYNSARKAPPFSRMVSTPTPTETTTNIAGIDSINTTDEKEHQVYKGLSFPHVPHMVKEGAEKKPVSYTRNDNITERKASNGAASFLSELKVSKDVSLSPANKRD